MRRIEIMAAVLAVSILAYLAGYLDGVQTRHHVAQAEMGACVR